MTKLILKLVFVTLAAATMLVSCNSKPTLQGYFLDRQDKPGFYIQSIPKSILGIKATDLSGDAKKAYESINKVNILFFPNNESNKSSFDTERKKVDAILASADYKTLISHSNDQTKMRMVYDGSQNAIDEVIVFGTNDEMGLGVARIMGDDMDLGSMMKLMNEMDKSNIDGNLLQNMMKAFPKTTVSK